MENPAELKYTASHEWLRDNGDGTASITLPGTLAAGDQTSVDLTLTVGATTEPGTLVNTAEIAAAGRAGDAAALDHGRRAGGGGETHAQ